MQHNMMKIVTYGRSVVFSGYSEFFPNKTDRHDISQTVEHYIHMTMEIHIVTIFFKGAGSYGVMTLLNCFNAIFGISVPYSCVCN